jgi:hypothetical protein
MSITEVMYEVHTCIFRIIIIIIIIHGMRLSPLGTAATVWPIVPTPDDR